MTVDVSARSLEGDRIVAAAMALVSDVGLRGLTLRDLAQSVGKSTTVIVNLFGSKSGLIEAMAEAALERDDAWHQAFFEGANRLAMGRDGLAALTGRYVRERTMASMSFVRVWEELLVGHSAATKGPQIRTSQIMARWEEMRRRAWGECLSRLSLSYVYGEAIATCLVIEQFYAGALRGRVDYEMIASEGVGGLIDRAFGRDDDPAFATESYIEQLVIPKAPGDALEAGSLKLRLLDVAADQILAGGVASVTNRSVSSEVKTSTSTIPYHWPDMRRFLIDAIWHAVFREMPLYLDYRHKVGAGPPDLQGWSELMAETLRVDDGQARGFYVKYARLIAQICLEARRDPAFHELAMILRGPEGGGTYVNRAALWPPQFDLTRRAATRFALWIKGGALMAAATGQALGASHLQDAARTLVAHQDV